MLKRRAADLRSHCASVGFAHAARGSLIHPSFE
jgi:hypothetical protein